ncbi:alpha/beta hydrolase [Hymenobacter sp. BT175]|uniref:alpha/beta hydrolase n=1 Tax=Hymenobacter translucens TaxID=2886507 RepID=UPI001D0E1681|nr:alpha/beta hydrolase [Hymenobacter translucens]MCC2545595.1 alpha/beta hydrolase [Hymenobacter translucens]
MPKPVFYLIPGLGADGRRLFRNLELDGEVHILEWLTPEPDESLLHYVARMAEPIPLDQPCLVVGISFGGTVALEICRIRPRGFAVLASSIPDADSLPPLLRVVRATKAYKLTHPTLFKLFPWAGKWYFGVKSGEEYRVFKEILADMEPTYTRWAVDRLLHWDSTDIGSCVQILGSHDRVFPPGPARVDYLIRGGTHFMIYTHGPEISKILNKLAAEKLSGANT